MSTVSSSLVADIPKTFEYPNEVADDMTHPGIIVIIALKRRNNNNTITNNSLYEYDAILVF